MQKASRLLQSSLRANLLNSIFCNHGRTAEAVLPFSFHASGNVIPTSGRGPAASIKLLGAGSVRTAHSQSDYSALLTRTLVARRFAALDPSPAERPSCSFPRLLERHRRNLYRCGGTVTNVGKHCSRSPELIEANNC